MRLIEVIASVCLASFFCVAALPSVENIAKSHREFCLKSRVFNRDRFITETFSKIAASGEADSEKISGWAKRCSDLFALDSISVGEAGANGKFLECTWQAEGKIYKFKAERSL